MTVDSATAAGDADASGEAPGRVNLLGEHTDYNDGFVLPTTIAQRTRVDLRRQPPGEEFIVRSREMPDAVTFSLDRPPVEPFARYVYGCVRVVADLPVDVPALSIDVTSNVPIGVGLSSSAALEVATLRALRSLLGLALDDVAIARLAHRAENEYAGVRCGLLDQMACSLVDGGLLYLDTRTLDRRVLPLPPDTEVLVVDSGEPRSLAGSGYNERRSECEAAAARLGLRSLRDATDTTGLDALPEPLRRRARHVRAENARVLQAATGLDGPSFGALMSASHASLRDDYEVSTPALDRLVGLLLTHDDVLGAKLTGAGFGGACVALCRAGSAASVGARVARAFNAAGGRSRVLVPGS